MISNRMIQKTHWRVESFAGNVALMLPLVLELVKREAVVLNND